MFSFSHLCDFLEKVQCISLHDPPFSPKEKHDLTAAETTLWFKSYRRTIDSLDSDEASALLSALLPHKRKDRIYGLQSTSLAKVLGRCLGLSASKRRDLSTYKTPGRNGDLAGCLQRVLQGGGPPALPPVTLLEIDDLLQLLAGYSRFSASRLQFRLESSAEVGREERLRQILFRSTPTQAKWLVRLVLKDFSPVELDEVLVVRQFHFLLPDILSMHNNLDAACKILKDRFQGYPSQPDPQSRKILRQTAAASLKPTPGLMVARSDFCKARSIKHCLQMTSGQRWLVDRKYDGEYCQIHVDLDKGKDWLKIYSKSGRDSTLDRQGLHDTIRRCLRIGSEKCLIKRQCILVGEMVVYSKVDGCIVGFDRIRRHVSRAGVFLGAEQDSPVPHGEHLMIVFFDLLLLDDENVMNQSVEQRKAVLSRVYKKIEGHAMSAESTLLDFGKPDSERKLMHQFAASNALRHEGLVLKPCGVPYLSASDLPSTFCPKTIKLKKDYISGLGDEADFAVIGASYNAQEANKRPDLNLAWTRFHLGCLMNESDVERFQAVPLFKIVATIAMDQCIPVPVLEQINAEGKFFVEKPPTTYTVQSDHNINVDVFFRKPFVFEVLGSSYAKPSNAGFFMLRHPRVKKMHGDQSWRDCITFDQLQNAAQEALKIPVDSETQEKLDCLEKLETSCKRKFSQMSCNTTPVSATSILTPRSKARRGTLGSTGVVRIHVDDVDSSPLARASGSRPTTKTARLDAPMPTPPTSSPAAVVSSCASPAPEKGLDAITALDRHKRRCYAWAEKENVPNTSGGMSKNRDVSALSTGPQKLGVLKRADEPDRELYPTSSTKSLLRREEVRNTPRLRDVAPSTDEKSAAQVGLSSEPIPGYLEPGRASIYTTERDCGISNHQRVGSASERIACFLKSAVIYLDKRSAGDTTRVTKSLRDMGATVTEDLEHWNRDSFAHPALSDTVSESQSYPGMRKVVLVDSKRPGLLCTTLAKVMALNRGGFRERVEIYDCKLVDLLCQERSMGKGSGVPWVQGYAIGAVVYEPSVGNAVFVPSDVGSSAETTTTGDVRAQ